MSPSLAATCARVHMCAIAQRSVELTLLHAVLTIAIDLHVSFASYELNCTYIVYTHIAARR